MTPAPESPCPTQPPRFGHGANPAVTIPAAVPDDQCSPVTGIREAAPVPGPPVRVRTGAAQTSAQALVPGNASGMRERLPGGASEYASGERPALDAPGAARTPTAAPGAAITLSASVHCQVCGDVPCGTMAEADKRAGRHTLVTRHATTAEARVVIPGAAG